MPAPEWRFKEPIMRTTLRLDDDVFVYAKQRAAEQGKPLGLVVSELARLGMKRTRPRFKTRNGFVLFDVPPGSKTFSLEDVKRAEEEEDERYARLVSGR